MQGIWSSAAVRSFSTHATRRASPRLSPLVMDASGELAAIPQKLPWASRSIRLDTLCKRFCDHLARHIDKLQVQDHRRTEEDNASLHKELRSARALWTLLSEGPRLLGRYEEQPLADARPRLQQSYVKQYQQESWETVQELFSQGPIGRNIAASYAAALPPSLRDRFLGDGWREAGAVDAKGGYNLLRMIERCKGNSDFDGLDEEQILALRDYAHSHSGVFDLVRACDELSALLPELDVTHCIREIPGQIEEAALALYQLPSARVWGNLFKGLQSRPGDHWQIGSTIVITRPYSTTVLPEQSYAGRVVDGRSYDVEFLLKDRAHQRTRAVLLVAFHPSHTASQGEALVLGGQVYRVQSSEEREVPCREGGSLSVVRYIAEKLADEVQ